MPAFFLSRTPQSAWSFGPFFLGTTAITVVLTQVFNSARGSLLVVNRKAMLARSGSITTVLAPGSVLESERQEPTATPWPSVR